MIWSQKELEQSNNTRISFFNTNNTINFSLKYFKNESNKRIWVCKTDRDVYYFNYLSKANQIYEITVCEECESQPLTPIEEGEDCPSCGKIGRASCRERV